VITTGQARRLANAYAPEGLSRLARTGTVTILERSVVEAMTRYEVAGSYRDPQGVMADARALAEWMDANVGNFNPEDWAGAWDTTVVPWSYRP
jgi:hypothetical protein